MPYCIGALALAFLLCSCDSGSRGQEASVDRHLPDTISVAEAEAIIDTESSATVSQEGFMLFMHNQELFASDTAACNRAPEAFREFVGRFTTEPAFRKSRVELYESSYRLPEGTNEGTFEQRKPDEDGFFSAWRVMEGDSVVFSSGWLNSEVAEEYTFVRKQGGLWYLVDYFNINNLQ